MSSLNSIALEKSLQYKTFCKVFAIADLLIVIVNRAELLFRKSMEVFFSGGSLRKVSRLQRTWKGILITEVLEQVLCLSKTGPKVFYKHNTCSKTSLIRIPFPVLCKWETFRRPPSERKYFHFLSSEDF